MTLNGQRKGRWMRCTRLWLGCSGGCRQRGHPSEWRPRVGRSSAALCSCWAGTGHGSAYSQLRKIGAAWAAGRLRTRCGAWSPQAPADCSCLAAQVAMGNLAARGLERLNACYFYLLFMVGGGASYIGKDAINSSNNLNPVPRPPSDAAPTPLTLLTRAHPTPEAHSPRKRASGARAPRAAARARGRA